MTDAKLFFIADYQIDLARSLIISNEKQTQVEPKVLKVLLLLAQRQNEVVTHQEIMEHVWQGTEVVPNALQRCIAILRKSLNDNAKSPTIIATHPRIGYSLLVPVKWYTPEEKSTAHTSPSMTISDVKNNYRQVLNIVSMSILFFAVFWLVYQAAFNEPKYSKIRPLTQTDAHESSAIYSPNANYIVFNRDAGVCKSHIWAKHLESQKEYQLTFKPGVYNSLAFTKDGREVVFAAKTHCEPLKSTHTSPLDTHQQCWNIATLDFSLALTSPQTPQLRLQCQAERLEKPVAIGNHNYAFLQYQNGQYQLANYNDLSKQLSTLYAQSNEYIYHFDYDPVNERFAVISRNKKSHNILTLLDINGKELNKNTIQAPHKINTSLSIYGNFSPGGRNLFAVSNNRLYHLDFEGQLQQIAVPRNNLISVTKHPSNNALLAILGGKDIDIAQLALGDTSSTTWENKLNYQPTPFKSLSRTAAQERAPQYQPHGNLIAFISNRTGQDQLWLLKNNTLIQLTKEPVDSKITQFSWSPNGQSLAYVTHNQLALIDLKGNKRTINTNQPLNAVLSWYTDNLLLVQINDPTPGGLYRYDLQTHTLTAYSLNQVDMAWVSNQTLVYSYQNGDVYTRPIEPHDTTTHHLPNLNGKALFVKHHEIYSVDADTFVLNQYDIDGQFIKPIMPLTANAWKVTDLKQHHLLLEQFIAINQEVVIIE